MCKIIVERKNSSIVDHKNSLSALIFDIMQKAK